MRFGARVGALPGDSVCAILRVAGARSRAARWRWVTRRALSEILAALVAAPLDRQVHALMISPLTRMSYAVHLAGVCLASRLPDAAVFVWFR